ncbi:MAG: PilN domain-containing protein [Balneolaceae bacterium]
MKLPFVEHIGIGLHITEKAIRWVELSRIRDQVRVLSIYAGKVEKSDVKNCLSKLVERINPSWKYVTVNIDSSYIKQKLINVPDSEDKEHLEDWLREQKKAMIPAGLKREEFVTGHHFTGQIEDEQKCLLLVARKEPIEARINLLKSVGLEPSIITTGDLETGYAFIFDPEFTDGESCLIKAFEDYSSLHFYDEGMLNNIVELTNKTTSVSEIFEEAAVYLATENQDIPKQRKLYAVISDYCDTEGWNRQLSGNAEKSIRMAKPLAHLKPGKDLPGSDLSVAAGMAAKQLYPALDTVNFLEDQHQENIREKIQKKDSLTTGLISGGVIIALFVLITGVQLFLSSKLDQTQQQLELVDDHITAVAEAREKVADLQQKVNHARELVGERTAMAGLMEIIGRSVPQKVWLNEMNIHESERSGEAVLYGFAYNDAMVASLMERLEKEQAVRNVRLIFSETTEPRQVDNLSEVNPASLVQFEVRMSVNPNILLANGGNE